MALAILLRNGSLARVLCVSCGKQYSTCGWPGDLKKRTACASCEQKIAARRREGRRREAAKVVLEVKPGRQRLSPWFGDRRHAWYRDVLRIHMLQGAVIVHVGARLFCFAGKTWDKSIGHRAG